MRSWARRVLPVCDFFHRSLAVLTVCPSQECRIATGVPWSNRIKLRGGHRSFQAASGEVHAFTCSRVSASYIATSSSMVIPSSRFSKTVATGMRVPRKTHATLTFPGTLSTTGHCDQSSPTMAVLPVQLYPRLTGIRPQANPSRFETRFSTPWAITSDCGTVPSGGKWKDALR